MRVRFSNAYGTSPLLIGAAQWPSAQGERRLSEGAIERSRSTDRPPSPFPPGRWRSARRDARGAALGEIAVSLYLPENVAAATQHVEGQQTNHISAPGNFTGAVTSPEPRRNSFYFLTGVKSARRKRAKAIVTLGDSLTDGFASTRDVNQRWPNLLAERLQSQWRGSRVACSTRPSAATVSCTIWWAPSAAAQARSRCAGPERCQVPDRAGRQRRHPHSGLIGARRENVTAEQIIQGHRQIIKSAHAWDCVSSAARSNPVEGYPFPGFWTTAMEEKRQAVNRWIRTGNAYEP